MTDNFLYHFVHYKILLIIVKYLKGKLSFKSQNVYISVLFGGEIILRLYIKGNGACAGSILLPIILMERELQLHFG
jgi:hypothetical protein